MTSKAPVQLGTDQTEPRTTSQLFATLADSRRRRVLSLLRERRSGVEESELATLVASAEADVPLRAVTDERHERVLVSLRHNHLPALESTGLVDRTGTTVRPADALVTGTDTVEMILDVDTASAATATTLDLLASERRRHAIQYLRAEGTATVDELVAAIRDAGDPQTVRLSLAHTHLPKLAEEGVISDDEAAEERRVVYEGLPVDERTVDELLPHRNVETR